MDATLAKIQDKIWEDQAVEIQRLPPGKECPLCCGMGVIRVDVPITHPAFGKPFKCLCKREVIAKRRWGASGIPKRRARCSFEGFDAMPADLRQGKENARHFAELLADRQPVGDDQKTTLTLSGAPGVGKSGLAASIARVWMDRGDDVLWLDVNDFFRAIYKSYESSQVDHSIRTSSQQDAIFTTTQIIESCQSVKLLILDDLGDMERRDPVTDHTRDRIYDVLHHRYDAEAWTVITTNLNYHEIVQQFGLRIAQRIAEMSQWAAMTGPNFRTGD